jgi:hypothetical protein
LLTPHGEYGCTNFANVANTITNNNGEMAKIVICGVPEFWSISLHGTYKEAYTIEV